MPDTYRIRTMLPHHTIVMVATSKTYLARNKAHTELNFLQQLERIRIGKCAAWRHIRLILTLIGPNKRAERGRGASFFIWVSPDRAIIYARCCYFLMRDHCKINRVWSHLLATLHNYGKFYGQSLTLTRDLTVRFFWNFPQSTHSLPHCYLNIIFFQEICQRLLIKDFAIQRAPANRFIS